MTIKFYLEKLENLLDRNFRSHRNRSDLAYWEIAASKFDLIVTTGKNLESLDPRVVGLTECRRRFVVFVFELLEEQNPVTENFAVQDPEIGSRRMKF
jgi:hypothetical protein